MSPGEKLQPDKGVRTFVWHLVWHLCSSMLFDHHSQVHGCTMLQGPSGWQSDRQSHLNKIEVLDLIAPNMHTQELEMSSA